LEVVILTKRRIPVSNEGSAATRALLASDNAPHESIVRIRLPLNPLLNLITIEQTPIFVPARFSYPNSRIVVLELSILIGQQPIWIDPQKIDSD
jgi:hypothetical protein